MIHSNILADGLKKYIPNNNNNGPNSHCMYGCWFVDFWLVLYFEWKFILNDWKIVMSSWILDGIVKLVKLIRDLTNQFNLEREIHQCSLCLFTAKTLLVCRWLNVIMFKWELTLNISKSALRTRPAIALFLHIITKMILSNEEQWSQNKFYHLWVSYYSSLPMDLDSTASGLWWFVEVKVWGSCGIKKDELTPIFW